MSIKKIVIELVILLLTVSIFGEKLYDLKDFFLSEIQKDVKVWDIYANYAEIMKNDEIIIKDFRFFIYKNGIINSTVIGKNGIINTDKDIEIMGETVIKDSTGIILNTNHINWDNKRMIFYNDTTVYIKRDNLNLYCEGIEYNDAEGHIIIKNNLYLEDTNIITNNISSNKGDYYFLQNLITLEKNVKINYDTYVLHNNYSEIKLKDDNNFEQILCLEENILFYETGNIKSDTIIMYFNHLNEIDKLVFKEKVIITDRRISGNTKLMQILFKDKSVDKFQMPFEYSLSNDTYNITGENLDVEIFLSQPEYLRTDNTKIISKLANNYDVKSLQSGVIHILIKDSEITNLKLDKDYYITGLNYSIKGEKINSDFHNNHPEKIISNSIFIEYFVENNKFYYQSLDDTVDIHISYEDGFLDLLNIFGNAMLFNLTNDTVYCSNYSFKFNENEIDKIVMQDKIDILKSNYNLKSDYAVYQNGQINIEDNLRVTELNRNNTINATKSVIENISGRTFEKIVLYNITNTILNF